MAAVLRGDNFACPLCGGQYRRFLPFGARLRANAMCPGSQSLERDRLLWLIWQQLWSQDRLPRSGRMLHVAPEPAFVPHFSARYDYLSIDLNGAKAMRAMDVTNLDFPEACFDDVSTVTARGSIELDADEAATVEATTVAASLAVAIAVPLIARARASAACRNVLRRLAPSDWISLPPPPASSRLPLKKT